jgi:hypothetical protein
LLALQVTHATALHAAGGWPMSPSGCGGNYTGKELANPMARGESFIYDQLELLTQ